MDTLREQALALQNELTALRRDFHMHPELGLQERRTAQRIEEELDKLGVAHRRVGETGVWATIRGTGAGGGAVALRVFGLHCAPDLPSGAVGLKPGANNAGVDRFTIEVRGLSTHVATPHLGVDALYIAAQIVVALQALATRRVDPVEPVILGVGKFHAGTTYNALAETAVLEGTTRTVTRETRERLRDQITALAAETAKLYGGTAELKWDGIASPLVNDAGAAAEAAALVERCWPEKRVVTDRAISLTGDDFAEYILDVPGAYAYLGTGNPARPETRHNIHSADFDLDEAALPFGAWLHAASAIAWLGGAESTL